MFQKRLTILFSFLCFLQFLTHSDVKAQNADTLSAFHTDSILWFKSFGGIDRDVGGSISIGKNDEFLIVGSTRSYGAGRDDIWLIKMDLDGDTLWTRTIGTSHRERTGTNSVVSAPDGGWVIGGSRFINKELNYDILLLGIDSKGHEQWRSTIGGLGRDQLESIHRTNDGGLLLAGATTHRKWETPWVLRTNSMGDTLWTRKFPGKGNGSIEAAIENSEGALILAGSADDNWKESTEYPIDMVIRKLNPDGSTIWKWRYGGKLKHVWPEWIEETDEGDIVVAGAICEPCSPKKKNYQTNFDAIVIKLTSGGDPLWHRRLGGNKNDLAYFLKITEQGTYMIGGSTSSHDGPDDAPWLVELDPNGVVIWSRILPSLFPRNGVSQIHEIDKNNYLISGPPWLYQRRGNQDVWILNIKKDH